MSVARALDGSWRIKQGGGRLSGGTVTNGHGIEAVIDARAVPGDPKDGEGPQCNAPDRRSGTS